MTDGKKVKGFLEHFGQLSSDFAREYADEIPSCTKLYTTTETTRY